MSAPRDEGRRSNRPRINLDELLEKHKLIVLNERTVEEDSDEEKILEEVLQVTGIDSNIKDNVKSHHTNEFDITDAIVYDKREFLVVRRGQQFTMTLTFNKPYDPNTDDLRIVFEFGKTPLPSRGTRVEFILSAKDESKEWGAFIKSREGTSLEVAFMTPATCAVGKWSLKVDVLKRDGENTTVFRYSHKPPIYILFNPWCECDIVYMKEEDWRKEYVLNENGKIYVGHYSSPHGLPWIFGQFTGDVLDCAIYLLDKKSRLPDNCRGDPVTIVRKISSLVNSNDNSGVLVGNWSDNYEGGTSPLEWTGSVGILEEYYKTKSPVCYGQCWVFSGVLSTVCRALGIPTRSVTNFASAHDKDGSTTIDMIFNSDNKLMRNISDSTWNFHVWNEVWLARPTLPSEYHGWQAVDATPQEVSGGFFQMGPLPVLAVKRGDLNVPFDGPFLFAEVNGDELRWLLDKDGSMKLISIDKHSVGKSISTKKIEGNTVGRGRYWAHREDITDQYKFPEDSKEERKAVKKASQYATSGERPTVYNTPQDVEFEIESDPISPLGKPIKCHLKLRNTSKSQRTIDGTVKLTSLFYTGVAYKDVRELSIIDRKLGAGEAFEDVLEVEYYYYDSYLKDHCLFKISSMFTVYETKQVFTKIQTICLQKPELTIKAPDSGHVGVKFEVHVSFENPLPVTLIRCELRVEGPGLQKAVTYKQADVQPNQTFSGKFDMLPVKAGQKEIAVYFNCHQMSAVNGSHPIEIKP